MRVLYTALKISRVLVFIAVFVWTDMAAAEIVEDGLIGYWTFDQDHIVGETVEDVVGSNHGTIGGDPEIVAGKYGEALEFDGDDYVDIGDIEMDDWPEISVSAWFNTDTVGAAHARIAAKDQQGIQGNWILWYSTGTKWTFQVHDGAWQHATCEESLSDGQWHYIVGTVSQDDRKIHIYVDGELKGSDDFGADTLDDSDEEIITVGADSDLDAKALLFTGVIDEFAIYNKALNEDEVRQNFAARDNKAIAVVSSIGKLISVWGKLKRR